MKKPTSEFLQAALRLEDVFAGIEQLSGSLDRLQPDSEAELERARKLLVRFTETSERLQDALETLVSSLQARRQSVEQAVGVVNDKASLIANMFGQAEQKQARLQELAQRVQDLSVEAPSLGTEELRARLELMNAEVAAIQEEARVEKLRSLQKNAKDIRLQLKDIIRSLD